MRCARYLCEIDMSILNKKVALVVGVANTPGVIRYRFHRLSYDYISDILPKQLGERAEDRVIVAHLGNAP